MCISFVMCVYNSCFDMHIGNKFTNLNGLKVRDFLLTDQSSFPGYYVRGFHNYDDDDTLEAVKLSFLTY